MRLALIGDIHANLAALDAALAFCEERGVDEYVCTGDLVGYGPQPDECVARVAALPGVCVAGNHDLIVRGELTTGRCIPLARQSLEWTARVAAKETVATLRALPRTASVAGGVVVAHGSLTDPEEYVRTTGQALAQLELEPQARVVILGHTHEPLLIGTRGPVPTRVARELRLEPGERYVVNPGSVGQSRERFARARVALLDLDRQTLEFHALTYDIRSCRRELRRRGLPAGACHLPPKRYRRLVRRTLGRVRGLVRPG
jgi:predicted phosphodiesterase